MVSRCFAFTCLKQVGNKVIPVLCDETLEKEGWSIGSKSLAMFSVHMRWAAPEKSKGQEVVFVLGKNNNKMRVKSTLLGGPGLWFSIDPNDKRNFGRGYGMSSPPAIYKNVVICGSIVPDSEPQGPNGDVRAFDALTGKVDVEIPLIGG